MHWRASMLSGLCLALAAAPMRKAGAQAAADSVPPQWRAWAFGRLGPAKTSLPGFPVFGSMTGGVAASYGAIVGMVRATDNEDFSFEGNQPYGVLDDAVLAGVRSRGSHLFVAGVVGVAQSRHTDYPRNSLGQLLPNLVTVRRLAPTFDLSAHADYLVAGLSLTVSGVLGPPPVRYMAASLGAELGWFGSR